MAVDDEPSIAIRPAALQDLIALVAIDAECFPSGIAYPREEIAALLRAPSIVTLVAERTGAVAGFAALGLSKRRSRVRGELITIDVLPQFRRQRIGHALYRELENRARRSVAADIELHVSVENFAALHFYQTLGYRRVARIPRYYLETTDAWRMEKLL